MRHSFMRIIYIVSVLLFVISCRTPTVIEGRYSTSGDSAVTELFFKADSTFTMRGMYTTRDTGQGIYILTRDSLILCYNADDHAPGRLSADTNYVNLDTVESYRVLKISKRRLRLMYTREVYGNLYHSKMILNRVQ